MSLVKIIIITTLLCSSFASGQTLRPDSLVSSLSDSLYGDCAFPYGEDYAFMIDAPKGWAIDNRSEIYGVQAVLYPEGSSWKDSKTVMYINHYDKKVKDQETIEKVLSIDSVQFMNKFLDGKITSHDSIESVDHNIAVVRYFEHKGQFDAVAYFNDTNAVEMLIMSSMDEFNFEKSLPLFRLFVFSYGHLVKAPDHVR